MWGTGKYALIYTENPINLLNVLISEASTLKNRLTNVTTAIINQYMLAASAADVTDVEVKMK